jgi:hypothetical protein
VPQRTTEEKSEEVNDVPLVTEHEDWYPLYAVALDQVVTDPPVNGYPRATVSREDFHEMTSMARRQEFVALGVDLSTPATATAQLLPSAQRLNRHYAEYQLPATDIAHLTLEETLVHLRIVYNRIDRYQRKKKKLLRQITHLQCRRRRRKQPLPAPTIESLFQELHWVRRSPCLFFRKV